MDSTQHRMICLIFVENLALGKPATSSAVILNYDEWSADKAVDGNRKPNIWCNSCLHTNLTGDLAFLRIDLGGLSTLSRVEIYGREPYGAACPGKKDRNDIAAMVACEKLFCIYICNKSCQKTTTLAGMQPSQNSRQGYIFQQ